MDSGLVKKTSDLTSSFKAVAVKRGYYEDEFIDAFVETTNHSPLMNILHTIRTNSLRLVLDKFVSQFPRERVQLVNLGVGFDTISFYALKNYENVVCFDTDFPDQMRTKSNIIAGNDIFRTLLPDLKMVDNFVMSERYKIVPYDLADPTGFNNLIEAGLSSEFPTLYFAEFVFMYVKSEFVNEVIERLYSFSSADSVIVVSEFVSLPTEITNFYSKLLKCAGVTAFGPYEYPNIKSQIQRYSRRWNVKLVCYSEFYNLNTSEEEKKRIKSLEKFEKMRELGALCSHIYITLLYKNTIPTVISLFNVENYDYTLRNDYDIPYGLEYDYNTEVDLDCFYHLDLGNTNLDEIFSSNSSSSFLNQFNVSA